VERRPFTWGSLFTSETAPPCQKKKLVRRDTLFRETLWLRPHKYKGKSVFSKRRLAGRGGDAFSSVETKGNPLRRWWRGRDADPKGARLFQAFVHVPCIREVKRPPGGASSPHLPEESREAAFFLRLLREALTLRPPAAAIPDRLHRGGGLSRVKRGNFTNKGAPSVRLAKKTLTGEKKS